MGSLVRPKKPLCGTGDVSFNFIYVNPGIFSATWFYNKTLFYTPTCCCLGVTILYKVSSQKPSDPTLLKNTLQIVIFTNFHQHSQILAVKRENFHFTFHTTTRSFSSSVDAVIQPRGCLKQISLYITLGQKRKFYWFLCACAVSFCARRPVSDSVK